VTRPTLTQATGPAHTRILGIGGARGENVVPNDDLVGPIDSSDEWIRQRTGIITRRRAGADTDVLDLAEQAARAALDHAGLTGADIDAVILSTVTYFHQTPAGAAIIADRIGATPAAAFDISAACAGYCYGIGQADALVRAGSARNVLVIGAEKMSEFVDPADRSISFLLGDGAGAVIVGPSDTPGIGPTVWGSDGSQAQAIRQTHSWLATRDEGAGWPTLRQEGQSVFKWAVWQMAPVAQKALDAAGVTADDIDAFGEPLASKHGAQVCYAFFGALLVAQRQAQLALGVDDVGERGVVHGVGRAGGNLLVEHLERLRGGARLLGGAAQAHEPGVERLRVGAQDLGGVALGVDGNEQHAQLVGVGAQLRFDLQRARQRGRADVGALGEAEEQHDGVAAIVRQGTRLAAGVLQLEIAGGHARQVHAMQLGGLGAAAGQGQQRKRGQQQAAARIGRIRGRVGRRRTGGREQGGVTHENLLG